jgi:hypothetical protein
MIALTDWFDSLTGSIEFLVPALVGLPFLLIGSLKLYGLSRGVVGGADKPIVTQLFGT